MGVDLQRFSISRRAQWRAETRAEIGVNDAFIFGFFGRLSHDKGIQELIEAFQGLPDSDEAVLICIGGMDGNGDVERVVEDAKRDANIYFVGPQSGDAIPRYMAAIDCLVHPTHREGFGMVLQEAGAMGCGIITTAIRGASEVMRDQESCILVPPRDPVALRSAMRRLVTNPVEARRLGENAYQHTREHFEREHRISLLVADTMELMREFNAS